MTNFTSAVLLLFLVVVVVLPTSTNAYAAWLKCFAELDPSEAVMGSMIKPYSELEEKYQVGLSIRPVILSAEEDGSTTKISSSGGEWIHDSYELPPSGSSNIQNFEIQLHVPQWMEEDVVQYVVEVVGDGKADDAAVATFVEPGASDCDGKRSFAREWDQAGVTLQVDTSSSTSDGGDAVRTIELVAAYALGFEQTKLTRKFTLKLDSTKKVLGDTAKTELGDAGTKEEL